MVDAGIICIMHATLAGEIIGDLTSSSVGLDAAAENPFFYRGIIFILGLLLE